MIKLDVCINTWPKLWEVGYGSTSQHKKGLLTMSSPCTHSERARHGGFQTLNVDIGQTADALWTDHLALWWRQTRTEIDRDRRRWRQTKTKTDTLEMSEVAALLHLTTPQSDNGRQRQTKTYSLWGWVKWQLPYSWQHPRVMRTELDTSPLMQPADSRAREGCSSLCSPTSSHGIAPFLSFLNLLSVKR